VVVVTCVGATSRTCSIRLVLGSICWQLASFHGLDTDLIPDDYPGLVAYFDGLLQVVSYLCDLPVIYLAIYCHDVVTHRSSLRAGVQLYSGPQR